MTRTDQIISYHVREKERKEMSKRKKSINKCTQKITLYFLFPSTANNYRVPLKGEHPDYINAVFINVMHCH